MRKIRWLGHVARANGTVINIMRGNGEEKYHEEAQQDSGCMNKKKKTLFLNPNVQCITYHLQNYRH